MKINKATQFLSTFQSSSFLYVRSFYKNPPFKTNNFNVAFNSPKKQNILSINSEAGLFRNFLLTSSTTTSFCVEFIEITKRLISSHSSNLNYINLNIRSNTMRL